MQVFTAGVVAVFIRPTRLALFVSVACYTQHPIVIAYNSLCVFIAINTIPLYMFSAVSMIIICMYCVLAHRLLF